MRVLRSDGLETDCLVHVLVRRIRGHHISVRQEVVLHPLSLTAHRPPPDLPEDEAEAVDVGSLETLEAVGVDVVAENLRGHVAPGAHPGVGGDVERLSVAVVPHGQTKVCYRRRPVIFDENISEQIIIIVSTGGGQNTHLDLMSL